MNGEGRENVAGLESFITGGILSPNSGYLPYDKDKMSDLSKAQREVLKEMIKKELEARRRDEETSKTYTKKPH